MIKWAFIFAVAAVIGLTGYRLVPVYFNNQAIKTIAKDVVSDTELQNSSKRDVLNRLAMRFRDNNLNHLDPKEIIKVARDPNGKLVLDVKYEERRKLMYNIELVAGFDEQFTY